MTSTENMNVYAATVKAPVGSEMPAYYSGTEVVGTLDYHYIPRRQMEAVELMGKEQ